MKNILLIAAVIFCSFQSYSQSVADCNKAKFGSKQKIKESEPCMQILADYILSVPQGTVNKQHLDARLTMLKWMGKTPDYTFSLTQRLDKICEENSLTGVHLACKVKAALSGSSEIEKNTMKYLVAYIQNKTNNVGINTTLSQLIEDWNNEKIEGYFQE